MQDSQERLKNGVFGFRSEVAILLFISLFLVNCSLQDSQPQNPVPNSRSVKKSFFFKSGAKDYFTMENAKPKTFVCGWAPEFRSAKFKSDLTNYNYARHCNLKFVLADTKLVGYLVNPSKEDDVLNGGEPAVTIPIIKNYNPEKQRDGYGREGKDNVEETRFDDPQARTHFTLNLDQIQIHKSSYQIVWNGKAGNTISDIEWDHDKNFLGFTLNYKSGAPDWIDSKSETRVRFNFMAFEKDKEFKKTKYHQNNSKYLNILHILGKRHDGVNHQLYAAKWDVGTEDKPVYHDIFLNQFPREYVGVGKDIINEWNKVFYKVKKVKPFRAVVKNLKYSFDLRYPTITWVNSKDASIFSPLGVGMATADVTNGKILWGGVTIWAGVLNSYINGYALGAAEAIEAKSGALQMGLINDFDRYQETSQKKIRENLRLQGLDVSKVSEDKLRKSICDFNGYDCDNLSKVACSSATVCSDPHPKEVSHGWSPAKIVESAVSDLIAKIDLARGGHEEKVDAAEYFVTQKYFNEVIYSSGPSMAESLNQLKSSEIGKAYEVKSGPLTSNNISMSLSEMDQLNIKKGALIDMDRTFANVGEQYSGLVDPNSNEHTKDQVFRRIIKDILLHEFGHLLGLGHNFKENIIPEKGTLPPKFINEALRYNSGEVLENADDPQTRKGGFIQMSTVMGYKHGITESITPYDFLKPGPMDRLVLTYLYDNKYPTYTYMGNCEKPEIGDDIFNCFKWNEVSTHDGQIPENPKRLDWKEGETEIVSYFPQCNDFHASTMMDPYCNRWDRGGDAKSLVKNYAVDILGGVDFWLNAKSNTIRQGFPERRSQALFRRTISKLSRIRLFYDHMRQRYDSKIQRVLKTMDDIQAFSILCRSDEEQRILAKDEENSVSSGRSDVASIYQLFDDNPELKNLCVANGIALRVYQSILELSGKSYSTIDYDNNHAVSSILGGDYSQSDNWYGNGEQFGKWSRLGTWPLKEAAIIALTRPFPIRPYQNWLVPIYRYSGKDEMFVYNTLYPDDFNKAVRSGLVSSMNLSEIENGSGELTDRELENPSISAPLRSLGWGLFNMGHNNDHSKYNMPNFQRILGEQFLYDYELVAIFVEKTPNSDAVRYAESLQAYIYNQYSNLKMDLGPAYFTEDKSIIHKAPLNSFIFPASNFTVYNQNSGYYLAYKITYVKDDEDRFSGSSAKANLITKYENSYERCVGGRSGLAAFYGSSKFKGILWEDETYRLPHLLTLHKKSINDSFKLYRKTFKDVHRETCTRNLKNLDVITNAAGILNGFMFTPNLFKAGVR